MADESQKVKPNGVKKSEFDESMSKLAKGHGQYGELLVEGLRAMRKEMEERVNRAVSVSRMASEDAAGVKNMVAEISEKARIIEQKSAEEQKILITCQNESLAAKRAAFEANQQSVESATMARKIEKISLNVMDKDKQPKEMTGVEALDQIVKEYQKLKMTVTSIVNSIVSAEVEIEGEEGKTTKTLSGKELITHLVSEMARTGKTADRALNEVDRVSGDTFGMQREIPELSEAIQVVDAKVGLLQEQFDPTGKKIPAAVKEQLDAPAIQSDKVGDDDG